MHHAIRQRTRTIVAAALVAGAAVCTAACAKDTSSQTLAADPSVPAASSTTPSTPSTPPLPEHPMPHEHMHDGGMPDGHPMPMPHTHEHM